MQKSASANKAETVNTLLSSSGPAVRYGDSGLTAVSMSKQNKWGGNLGQPAKLDRRQCSYEWCMVLFPTRRH